MSTFNRLPNASAPAGAATPDMNEPRERELLMAEFGIAYNGRHYEYGAYRYDHLADAINYAKLQRAKPSRDEEARSMPSREHVEEPDESQRALMATLAITFQDGVYRLGGFRYDRLTDAIQYARLQSRRSNPI